MANRLCKLLSPKIICSLIAIVVIYSILFNILDEMNKSRLGER